MTFSRVQVTRSQRGSRERKGPRQFLKLGRFLSFFFVGRGNGHELTPPSTAIAIPE